MSKNSSLEGICREYGLPVTRPIKYKEKSGLGIISEWNVTSIEVVARGETTGVDSLLLKFEDREPVRICSDYLREMQSKRFGKERTPQFRDYGEIYRFIASASCAEDLKARCSLVEECWESDGFPVKVVKADSAQESLLIEEKRVNDYPQTLKNLVQRIRNELANNRINEDSVRGIEDGALRFDAVTGANDLKPVDLDEVLGWIETARENRNGDEDE